MKRIERFLRRYGVVHDLRGPRVRLGLAWAVVGSASLLLGSATLAAFFVVNAGVAALQTAARWRDAGVAVDQPLAAVGAGALVLAAWLGGVVLGVALIVFAVAAVLFPEDLRRPASLRDVRASMGAAWGTLASGLFVGLAGGAVLAVHRVDVMVVLFLALAVCVYDAGDFLCTGGTRDRYVGPLSGMAGVAVVAVAMALLQPPPFSSGSALFVGLLLVVLCPAGQWLGSWILPSSTTRAPGLRRLDAWLIAAPVVMVATWIAQS